MKIEKSTRLVEEGNFVARVSVTLLHDGSGWSPYLSHEDMLKLDDVREALRRGDIDAAAKEAKVYELLPISA